MAAIKQRTVDITECSICFETFINPRSLPCIHSFCLECLKKYGSNEKPGNKMSCPMCRQMFTIPAAGFDGLSKNFFLEHIMAIKASEMNSTCGKKIMCDLCSDDEDDNKPASGYCVECHLNLCAKCSGRHRKQPFAKSHSILSLEEKEMSQNLSHRYATFCDTHKEEQLKLFCYDCSVAVCLMCFAVNHNGHKCSDIQESAEKFRVQLQSNKMIACISSTEKELKTLDDDTQQILHQAGSAQKEIKIRANELKSKIENEQRQLEEQLDQLKEKRLEYIAARRADLTLQVETMKSFTDYTKELLERGSACDISRSAIDLMSRRDQLITSQTKFNGAKLHMFNISYDFTWKISISGRANVPTLDTTFLLGRVTLNGNQVDEPNGLQQSSRVCPQGCQQTAQQQRQQQLQRQNRRCLDRSPEVPEICRHGYEITVCPNDCMNKSQRCIHGFQVNVVVDKRRI